MYKVEYLTTALSDMSEIIKYIRDKLVNKQAAVRLSEQFVEAAERISFFPYANTIFVPIRPLKEEYRKVIVENYLIFYYVKESAKTVVISRIIYARNYMDQIK